MKKIVLCSLIAVVAFGAVCTDNNAFGGDVNSACYAVKGTYLCPVVPPVPHSYCGGKTAAKWVAGIYGLGTGAAVGTAAGSIFGLFGAGAGAVAGGYAGAKLGGKIGTNYSANEYIYFEDGSCLECDSHNVCEDFECPNRTVVTNGTKAYMCHVEASGDYWQEYDIPICSDSERNIDPKKEYKTYLKDNVTNNGKRVKNGVLVFSGSVCVYTEEVCPECNGGGAKTEPVKSETKMCNFDGKKVSLGYCEQSKDCQRATLADTKTGEVCKRCCGENSKGQMENKYLITKCPSGKNGIGFKDAEKTFKPKEIYNGSYRVCEEKKNSCKELYAGYPERIKCCEAGKATKWTGSVSSGTCSCVDKTKEWKDGKCIKKSDATCEEMYKGNEVAIACCNNSDSSWNSDLKECECNEENKNWKYDEKTKTGKCIDNGSVSPSITCTEANCKITINQTIRCFNNGNYFNSTENYSVCKEDLDALRLDCNGLKTRVNACQNTDCIRGLLTRIEAFDELIAKVCNSSGAPTPVVVPDNSAKIAAAKQIVSSFFGSAESNKSVWKDAQGNFNTARLASDLTAGVVLGTVGGVVSGVVIKKKQVEKGFDALHCAVGGQTVADWGDTFNVGLRR